MTGAGTHPRHDRVAPGVLSATHEAPGESTVCLAQWDERRTCNTALAPVKGEPAYMGTLLAVRNPIIFA